MLFTLKRYSLKLSLLFAAPLLAFPAAVQVNGTCAYGSCSNVDVLNEGQSVNGSFSYLYTFGNGDQYQISSPFSASNSSTDGTNISFNPAVTYLGNSSQANAPSQADVLVIDLLQKYNWAGSTTGYYDEDTTASMSGPVGPGSTYEAQLFFNGNGLGLMGPYGPGTHTGTGEVYLSNLSNPLSADFQFTYRFGAGSAPGAGIATVPSTAAVPEPSSWACVLGGFVSLAWMGLRGKRSKEKNG